jgi:hypothetical protein
MVPWNQGTYSSCAAGFSRGLDANIDVVACGIDPFNLLIDDLDGTKPLRILMQPVTLLLQASWSM